MYRGNFDYSILVIGLGSMGKRRIRNLKAMGFKKIYGFDLRDDRQEEARALYGIQVVNDVDIAMRELKIEVLIISVPPHLHHLYINRAIENEIHFFVEASVVDEGMEEAITKLKSRKIVAAPSGTLYFHPAIQKIKSIIESGDLGHVTNFIYHSGQYLPDWHSYEKVEDFYVSKKETGGAREIVPFELTWITKLLGFPNQVAAVVKKTIQIKGAEEIDDTYNILLHYDGFIVNMTIDVVSRHATRKLLINGADKQLTWNWDDNCIKIFDPATGEWDIWNYESNDSAPGYNKNIIEQMYIMELHNFFDAIENKNDFFNSMDYDHKVLKLLYTIENSSSRKNFQDYKP
ncbi:MAG TPA: Gfo/Idh/MocA family oxidoreductase [Bacteroidia bacterium]|nr:Gfo/Idh/MocA family oxidoreductase [Bacteroidia bacterium]